METREALELAKAQWGPMAGGAILTVVATSGVVESFFQVGRLRPETSSLDVYGSGRTWGEALAAAGVTTWQQDKTKSF